MFRVILISFISRLCNVKKVIYLVATIVSFLINSSTKTIDSTLSQTSPFFMCLVTSNFSFSLSVFYPFGELCTIFIKFEIIVCILFQCGRVQMLSFGKELRYLDVPLYTYLYMTAFNIFYVISSTPHSSLSHPLTYPLFKLTLSFHPRILCLRIY